MKLSIIIVSYNTKELLEKCLESVADSLQQTAISNKLKAEIIVVDNGSMDGSVEAVKEFIEKNSYQFVSGTEKQSRKEELRMPPIRVNSSNPTIKLIKNRANLGFAKAVNQGIKQSQGDVIFLLNSDAQVQPGALEELLSFEGKVGPTIIGGGMINPDGTLQPSVFHLPTIRRAIREYWLGEKESFSKYLPAGNIPVEVEAVSGGAMLISRDVIEKIGLLDERYFMYFEDLDYCSRAKKAGFKIYYLPTAEVIHEHGASGKNLASPKDQWKRLIPSSKIYYGWIKHYLINFIIWSGQKCLKRKKQ